MKQLLQRIIAVVLSLTLLAACGSQPEPVDQTDSVAENKETEGKASEVDAAAKFTMRIGHVLSGDSPRHQSLLQFKEEVEEKTGGGIEVQIFPSAQLGTEAEITDMVKTGSLEATRCGSFEPITPKLLIYTMPFLFDDLEQLKVITQGAIGEKIVAGAEENGLTVLATGRSGGFRQFTNNVHPINVPEDMEGLKMRTPPIESIIKIMEALGASPVSVPFTETYMALKTGVADGEENPFQYIESQKFYEVQEYLTIVNYQVHPEPFAVNLDWYKSLSDDYQAILKEAAINSMNYNDELVGEKQDEAFELIKNSMVINELTEEQKMLFVEQTKSVYDYYYDSGVFTEEEVEEIRNAIN